MTELPFGPQTFAMLPGSILLGKDCSKYEDWDGVNFPQLSSSLVAFVYYNAVGSPKASSEFKKFWRDHELWSTGEGALVAAGFHVEIL